MNHGNACFYLAGMYMSGVNAEMKSFGLDDKRKADAAVNNFELAKDMKKAFALTEKACDLNTWQACANLSAFYTAGEHTDKNPEKAKQYKDVADKLRDKEKQRHLMQSFH